MLGLTARGALLLAGLGCGLLSGCAQFRGQSPGISNPLFVRTSSQELVWERAVDVLHEFVFEIERENRLNGMIETRYKTGSGVLEPWHRDSATATDRWESTLQSIRRKVFVSITPAQGGFFVGVEAIKEIEDVPSAPSGPGAATFSENDVLARDLSPVVKGQATSTWIPKGRDPSLEAAAMDAMQQAFSS